MATETVINRPAPFVEDIGKSLAEQTLALQNVPVVTQGLGAFQKAAQQAGLPATKQAFETQAQFDARKGLFDAQQRAALGFDQRQLALQGLAPQVAAQDQLQKDAQSIAQAQAGQTGIAGFQPFLNRAQQEAQLASGLGTVALGQLGAAGQELTGAGTALGTAGTTLGGVPLGAQAFQRDVSQFMSPYQSQVIDATLSEFDRNKAIQEQSIRDQQAALGALGSGRAGVQLAEFGTGAARERALLQAGLLQQGFQQAQGARQQDIQNRFGLGQAQAGLAGQQAGFAGQRAGLGQATQGLGAFRSGLGGQQAALGAQTGQIAGQNLARLGQLGALNQAQRQAELDAQREATRQATFLPQEQLGNFADITTGIMGGMRGTGTVATNVPNPTPLQTALGIGTTLAGAYLGRGT